MPLVRHLGQKVLTASTPYTDRVLQRYRSDECRTDSNSYESRNIIGLSVKLIASLDFLAS